jgi:hypothetical protein
MYGRRTPSEPKEKYESVLELVRTFTIKNKPIFVYTREYRHRVPPKKRRTE